jgi:hypothetical protein
LRARRALRWRLVRDQVARAQQLTQPPGLKRAAAWPMRWLGVCDLRNVAEPGDAKMRTRNGDRKRSSASRFASAVSPRTGSQASTNEPISHGHTVP